VLDASLAIQQLPVVAPISTLALGVVDAPSTRDLAAAHEAEDPVDEYLDKKSTYSLSNKQNIAPVLMPISVRNMVEPAEPVLAPGPTVPPGAESDFWFALVQDMVRAETIGALVRELALQSQLIARDDTGAPAHWLLRVENSSLNQASTRDRLQQALQRHQHQVHLAVEVGKTTDTPARRLAAAAAQRQAEAEAVVLQDPFVQKMMHEFGGKIVPGSLRAVATPAPSAP